MSCHCIGDLISQKCPEHRSIYKWQEAYEKDQKEIERLEAELEQTEREAQCAASNADKYHNIIREQRAENERLREALQYFYDYGYDRGKCEKTLQD